MQAVMDYKGYRMTAMPLLPLQSLVYGSSDGGTSLKHENPQVNEAVKKAGESLCLAGHLVRNFDDTEICSAADVEAHEGKDDRVYLLDLARTFPPQSPKICTH